jgi:hypothetical protein
MRFYGPYKHLWALTVRGRDLVGRGRTPRPSERGVGALVQIETRGREGSRGVTRGHEGSRRPEGAWKVGLQCVSVI